jgi:hypothetical protein
VTRGSLAGWGRACVITGTLTLSCFSACLQIGKMTLQSLRFYVPYRPDTVQIVVNCTIYFIYSLFDDPGSNSDHIASNDSIIVNNDLETMCKEAAVA